MAVNPYILAPLQAKKEKSIGAPLGNILTKGAGILGKFAQRNPALLLGLGSSLLSGKGFGPSLADAGKAQATANKYITDQEAAKQAAHLARLKYLNEVRKTDIDEYRADTDRWKAQNPSPSLTIPLFSTISNAFARASFCDRRSISINSLIFKANT